MTIQHKLGRNERLSLQEVGKRSRLALRTSDVGVGILLADPEVVGIIVDNLIPIAILDPGPLLVRVNTGTFPDPQDGDEYELWLRKGPGDGGIMVADDTFGPVAGRPAIVDIEVVTTSLDDDDLPKASTLYEIQLALYKGTNGNEDLSGWVPIEIDRFAPVQDKDTGYRGQPDRIVYRNLPSPPIIDDDWMNNNPTLELTIGIAYDFYRPDDTVNIYIDTAYGSTIAPVYTGALASSTVSVPNTGLPTNNGRFFIWYTLTDVVGNVSERSFSLFFDVARQPPPALREMNIPKGILPDVIDLEDIQTPVHAHVLYTTNGQPTDLINAHVGLVGATSLSLGTQPLGNLPGPLQFLITTNRLLQLWGASTAQLPIEVSYRFNRGVEPPRDSAVTPSALDFSYRGPVNPTFPDLENPNMTQVTVLGDSRTPNHITAADRGKEVEISTPMVELPVTWTPIGDETVRLWYNGVDVHSELLSSTPTLLKVDVPASVIDAAGPGTKIAYWSVEETGGRNVMKSLPTSVLVDAVLVVLPQPTVRLFNGFVSCRYLERPDFQLPVTVPIDVGNMPTGTTVTVRSVGTSDALGLVEIPGTEFSAPYTINGSETGGIFVLNIQPYLTKLKPIQPPASSGLPNGYIKIWYEITIGGVVNPSTEFFNEVSLLNTSNNYCDGSPVN
ncbi:hypothetical protein [Pseudomonas sp. NPDC086278]|uniref:hypothetical protein n=1 Tax=Pseudomonas sp. NPDC086278 TaxID=3390646 RepID=UPI003D024CFA